MAGILIVDDSSTIRKLLASIVKKLGHSVIAEARTGLEAFEMYEKFKPDIVTMDMEMPGGDGLNALKHIIMKYPNAIILMVTSINVKEKVLEAIRLGAKNYIVKPIDEQKVTSVLNDIIEKYMPVKDREESVEPEMKSERIMNKKTSVFPFLISGSVEINIFENINDELINQLTNSIHNLLLIRPLKVKVKAQFPQTEIYAERLYKITEPIRNAGGMVDIEYN